MSWTSNGFFRNCNILAALTPADVAQPKVIYQPGTLNPQSLSPDKRYSGFITSLRLVVDVRSVPEVEFPQAEVGMSDSELRALMRGAERTAPKKAIALLMGTSGTPPQKIATISLFNRRPYYAVDLLLYLTDAAAFDVASDCILSLQMEQAGFGFLTGNDRVVVHGSAVEEAENTAPSLIINITGGSIGDGGGGDPVVPANAVTTDNGTPITTDNGTIVEV